MLLKILLMSFSLAAADNWVLDYSTVTYTITHVLKTVSGKSTSARGKGKCENGHCDFLIGVPVKTFDSGDSNRDLHMLEVTRGGSHPMITVRTSFEEKDISNQSPIPLAFNIEFAGKEKQYKNIPFNIQKSDGHSAHTKGTIIIKLSDFEITPPSLLTMAIKNDVPIAVDAFWKTDTK